MPKPVLSDSLFNADDVATAVLAEANLQITNANLGVTDITSSFTRTSNWSLAQGPDIVFTFNGFVFYNLGAFKNGTPSSGEVIWQIASDYIPSVNYHCISSTHQGDGSHNIEIGANGDINIIAPYVPSGSDIYHRVIINGWYRL